MNRFEQAVYDCMNPTAELLEETTKPLHRAMLLNFWRHVHLEGAGEYERIMAPDMTVDVPERPSCHATSQVDPSARTDDHR